MLRKAYHRIFRRKQDDTNNKEGWDESYRAGNWDRLHALDEFAHNAVVAGYCNAIRQPSGIKILDVGCGEGLLLNFLNISQVENYLGIDISDVAIARAAPRSSRNIQFAAMNIEDAALDGDYSIIVVNECAYYFRNLVATMRKMRERLRDDGYIIVSMYLNRQTEALWDVMGAELKMVDSIEIKNAKGTRWKVVLFQKA